MIRKSKFLPVLVLSIIIIVAFFSLFKLVNASSSFSKKDSNWYNLSNKIDASKSTYPYGGDEVKETGQSSFNGSYWTKQTNVSITTVSSYITYGTTKWLMGYMGELPYNNIRTNAGTDDEKIISGFSGYYSIDGTDMHADVNPDFKGGNGVPATDYWGIKINSEEFANKKEAEEINENGVVSLRLYANQSTFSNWFTFFIGNKSR